MIRLNNGCDKRVRYCALIFAADIVPCVSTIQWDLKKPACESTEGSARPLKKKISCQTQKWNFFKKAIDRFGYKLHFWNRHIISYRMVFVVSFEHFMTFRRTVHWGGGGARNSPPDLRNYWTDSKNCSGIRKLWKNCRRKTSFNDLGVTSDVTGQVKVKMFDISGLVTSASKISMLSANKVNESAWIVSLTFVSIISCAL